MVVNWRHFNVRCMSNSPSRQIKAVDKNPSCDPTTCVAIENEPNSWPGHSWIPLNPRARAFDSGQKWAKDHPFFMLSQLTLGGDSFRRHTCAFLASIAACSPGLKELDSNLHCLWFAQLSARESLQTSKKIPLPIDTIDWKHLGISKPTHSVLNSFGTHRSYKLDHWFYSDICLHGSMVQRAKLRAVIGKGMKKMW